MTVNFVRIFARLLVCAIEVEMLWRLDNSWCFVFISDTSRCSVENASFEVRFENSIGTASHVPQDESVSVSLEIAEEEKRSIAGVYRIKKNFLNSSF